MTQADQEQLASLAYLSGAGDSNLQVSDFINRLNNQVYNQLMNQANGL